MSEIKDKNGRTIPVRFVPNKSRVIKPRSPDDVKDVCYTEHDLHEWRKDNAQTNQPHIGKVR